MSRPKKTILPGRLVVIEGPDAVGKSTLAALLARRLATMGTAASLAAFPGNIEGSLGAHIYRVHNASSQFGITAINQTSLQLLHIAAHVDEIEARINPRLRRGETVILDRYWWSTWAYGRVNGVTTTVLDAMIRVEREIWGSTRPDLIVLMRRVKPLTPDVDLMTWKHLDAHYCDLAKREKDVGLLLLDDTPNPEAACESVIEALSKSSPIPNNPPRQGDFLDLLAREKPMVTPIVLAHLSPIKVTEAYDTYWRFAAERQEVFFKRIEGRSAPWTEDPILREYKFTNAYRASDRVSQFLIQHVIYSSGYPRTTEEVFFRVILFKLFNKISTWELLERHLGPILYSEYSFSRYDRILTEAMARGERIYSGAYIMPSGGRVLGSAVKHRNHLRLIEKMMTDDAPCKVQNAKSLHGAFDVLLSYPTIGEFLAYQYTIDLNYSEILSFNERDFVVPGPGALDGIRKCFADLGGLNEPELIRFVADRQNLEFERLGLSFRSLWGRPLQLIDCQNLFCEVDKYSRVRHPEITGISGRTRIKQRFMQNPAIVRYWYPPKWGLNEMIANTAEFNRSKSEPL